MQISPDNGTTWNTRASESYAANTVSLTNCTLNATAVVTCCKRRLNSAAGGGGRKVRHLQINYGGCLLTWSNGTRFAGACWSKA